ncbi:hypothetical protein T492DRAFT_845698 [Pavlovales sp. CCMP2436]|nr:hypothetical protein T492DRAFT_845698 [Pavlovales sp. CCMP2436]
MNVSVVRVCRGRFWRLNNSRRGGPACGISLLHDDTDFGGRTRAHPEQPLFPIEGVVVSKTIGHRDGSSACVKSGYFRWVFPPRSTNKCPIPTADGAMPSSREHRLESELKAEEEHVNATDAMYAEQVAELKLLRARNDDLTRELAHALGESRSLRHEFKALSRCFKGQLDERSLRRGTNAPAQPAGPGAAKGAAAAPPFPAADDECAAGGYTFEANTEYARAPRRCRRLRGLPPDTQEEPGAPGSMQQAWVGADDLDADHDDDERAHATELEVLPGEFEILDLAVEEDEDFETLDRTAEEEEEFIEQDEASPPWTQHSETAEPQLNAHHGRSFGKSPRQTALRTPSNLAFDECFDAAATKADAVKLVVKLLVKACGDARAAYGADADDHSAKNY